jgi:AAA domain
MSETVSILEGDTFVVSNRRGDVVSSPSEPQGARARRFCGDGACPWLMLLGENGTGKSSILQAVALALVGDSYRERLGVDPRSYLRRGTRRGAVEIYLGGSTEPIRLAITRAEFKSSHPEPKESAGKPCCL